ncbi:phosphonate transport system substrate-binding protein [Bacillus mesophilus]|uniref:Phosphate/phosphite/phosphonate ABC transporter substrate-binding protein n=1 Tax=Bacillus mesophilus TaxID=1808955 RepID=A0A6M0Q6U8_9BACI|nr:phosphate/phosphite/phosphonate ABC transporter substrate-binding protein [Bacillus mesophilus]MBM7659966.1 phosphonate transport system substrate-binding protein [Bacillus mesophilus]NEY70828.1 phosphate/phosphite/phosphonate ABC transporter substrate-binding protein [Bacillus mesophilus]
MKKFLSLFMAMFLVLALAACGTNGKEEEGTATEGNGGEEEVTELTMGFIPSQEADQIADNVKPLEDYLTAELGVPVKAEIMIDFVGLVEGMRTGQIDIGFTNPFGYVQAVDRANVEVLVKAIRHGSDTYKAQFIARADSGLTSVEDLVAKEGLTWAYGDTLSTSGFLFPASKLMDMGVEDLNTFFTQTAVGGHDNAVLSVLEGQADFATTFDDARTVLEKDHPNVMEEVVVIGHTDPIPNDGVSVREGLSDEMKNKIKEAFLAINDKPEVLSVMNEVYTWDGIAEATDEEYDIVREVYAKFKDQLEE